MACGLEVKDRHFSRPVLGKVRFFCPEHLPQPAPPPEEVDNYRKRIKHDGPDFLHAIPPSKRHPDTHILEQGELARHRVEEIIFILSNHPVLVTKKVQVGKVFGDKELVTQVLAQSGITGVFRKAYLLEDRPDEYELPQEDSEGPWAVALVRLTGPAIIVPGRHKIANPAFIEFLERK